MKLVAKGFSPNGLADMIGTVIVYSDSDEPLGVEHAGNYSKDADRKLKAKCASIGLDLEVVEAKLHRLLAQLRNAADESDIDPSGERPHELPPVVTTGRYMREIVRDCWALLRGENANAARFFEFGKELSEVLDNGGGTVTPRGFTYTELYGTLDRMCDFISRRTNATGETTTWPDRPPKDVVQDMLALLDHGLPYLKGVVSTPICRPDGSIVTQPGYDRESHRYLTLPVGFSIPEVSVAPSADEVERALDLIGELFLDFPFASDADRAHAIGAILTTLVRAMISGPTPLFMAEAPVPGSGKGLLVQVVTYIATGTPVTVMTEATDEDEWRKRLTARLVTAPQVILIDNVKRRLDSSALSAALTADPLWEDRWLGKTKTVSVPVTCTWFATANNPAVSDEIARRLVRIRLDPETEIPWERDGFLHPDLRGWVRDNRGDLIWAALTLVRAWVAAGRPSGTEVMGSFESWAATVGGILEVAGVHGFLSNRQEVYAQARSETEAWRTFVDIWARTFGEQPVGVDRLFMLAKDNQQLTELRTGHSDKGARTAMGMNISKLRDRVVGAYSIRYAGEAPDGKRALWKLDKKEGREKVREGTDGTENPQ